MGGLIGCLQGRIRDVDTYDPTTSFLAPEISKLYAWIEITELSTLLVANEKPRTNMLLSKSSRLVYLLMYISTRSVEVEKHSFYLVIS